MAMPGLDFLLAPATRLRTLYRWLLAFAKEGFPGLEPAGRAGPSLPLPRLKDLLDFVVREKRDNPGPSVPELIRRARLLGVIKRDLPMDCASTVYRWLLRLGVPVFRVKTTKERDTQALRPSSMRERGSTVTNRPPRSWM